MFSIWVGWYSADLARFLSPIIPVASVNQYQNLRGRMSSNAAPFLIYVSSLPSQSEARFEVELQAAQSQTLTSGLVWDQPHAEYDWSLVRGQIERADAFLLMLGDDYGPVTPTGISAQHRELVHAQSLNKPIFCLIHNSLNGAEPDMRLDEFRALVKRQEAHKVWHLRDELSVHSRTIISNWQRDRRGETAYQPPRYHAPAPIITPAKGQPPRNDIDLMVQANVYRGGNLAPQVVKLPMKTDRLWRSLLPLLRLGASEDRLRAHIEQLVTAEISQLLLDRHPGSHAVDGVRLERNQFRQLLSGWAGGGFVKDQKDGARVRWSLVSDV